MHESTQLRSRKSNNHRKFIKKSIRRKRIITNLIINIKDILDMSIMPE